jgi:hypothetical protein
MFFCLLIAFALGACQSNSIKKTVDTLNYTVKDYGKFIRWRAYDEATNYLRHQDGRAANKDTSTLQEIRVTKYQVLTVEINEENQEATVKAEITYYHERVNSVKTIIDQQLWWRDEESNQWFLDGKLPDLKP